MTLHAAPPAVAGRRTRRASRRPPGSRRFHGYCSRGGFRRWNNMPAVRGCQHGARTPSNKEGSREASHFPTAFCVLPAADRASAAAAGGGLLGVLGLAECAAGGVGLVAGAGALVERDEAFEDGAGARLEAESGLVVLDRFTV